MTFNRQRGSELVCSHSGLKSPKLVWRLACLVVFGAVVYYALSRGRPLASAPKRAASRAFFVTGIIKELQPEQNSAVISQEAIPGYMEAMTMPFNTRNWEELVNLQAGDQVSFRLSVTESESWIDQIHRTDRTAATQLPPAGKQNEPTSPVQSRHPVLDYPFTNELGQAVRLGDFQGQALAITFFFTRCPIPDFCPRLSKNFAQASLKLDSLQPVPTNWHFLSVSFDPGFDTPSVLKAYAEKYHYDPSHWSFLTGPRDKIAELARLSNVQFEPDNGLFNHNFRTMVIDAAGRLQMVFPTGGDLSDALVSEMLKATGAVTNKTS
jgi:protein SCO1/2